jgi:mono/diheme cytochrome c family protein
MALGGLTLACAGALPPVTPALVERAVSRWPDSSEASLKRGRRLFVDRCSGCHSLVLPREHGEEEWSDYVDAMSERARLTRQEAELVLRYLVGQRAATP